MATTISKKTADALQAEADRLFAEHHALAEANQRRAKERDGVMMGARLALAEAHTAHEHAGQAWEAAIEARRTDPTNPTLLTGLNEAEVAYQAACAKAERVNREVQAVLSKVFDESLADTEALLALGQRARAAQDAWFVSTAPTAKAAP